MNRLLLLIGVVVVLTLFIFFYPCHPRVPRVKGSGADFPKEIDAWFACARISPEVDPPWTGKVYVDDVLFSCADVSADTQTTRLNYLGPGESVSVNVNGLPNNTVNAENSITFEGTTADEHEPTDR